MNHIETDHLNPTEFIHSMRNVSRDTNQKKQNKNKKQMKKNLKDTKKNNNHRDTVENKGSNIDVVIG